MRSAEVRLIHHFSSEWDSFLSIRTKEAWNFGKEMAVEFLSRRSATIQSRTRSRATMLVSNHLIIGFLIGVVLLRSFSLESVEAFANTKSSTRTGLVGLGAPTIHQTVPKVQNRLRNERTILPVGIYSPSSLFQVPPTINSERRRISGRTSFLKKGLHLFQCSIIAFGVCSASFASRARAATIATTRHSVSSLFEQIPWKAILKASLVVWAITIAITSYQVKKRQAKMATSEWSRYARRPDARGRAIVWLMIQQAIFILASKIIRTKRSDIRKYAGNHFADALLKLGPLYIKLGQIISCRKNLLGPEWIEAMSSLQDGVPANTGQDALDLAYTTLEGGKEEFDSLFSEFDSTPLAAASLGQVHKATLRSNGDRVAVKVQRPFLRKIYYQDLEFLTTIAQFMDKLPSASKNVGGVSSSWTKIFKDAEAILYREIDYRDEAANGARIAEDFGLTRGGNPVKPKAKARNNETLPSAADWIRVPYVYQNISSERLLVMEFVPSIKVTDQAKLKDANVTMADQIDLADSLARAYLRQFCCNHFFSTDPHPGNVGIEIVPDGKPRLVLYDFGQAATLSEQQADGILQIIEAIIDMDVDRSIEAFQKMGVLVDGADLDRVRAKVEENYRTGKVKANRKSMRRKGYKFKGEDNAAASVSSTASSMPDPSNASATAINSKQGKSKDAEVMAFFSLPAEYAFVARAISQMDGVGKGLDPDFDFISNSAPYIVEIKGTDKYLKEELQKFFNGLQGKITKLQSETIPHICEEKFAEWHLNQPKFMLQTKN